MSNIRRYYKHVETSGAVRRLDAPEYVVKFNFDRSPDLGYRVEVVYDADSQTIRTDSFDPLWSQPKWVTDSALMTAAMVLVVVQWMGDEMVSQFDTTLLSSESGLCERQ